MKASEIEILINKSSSNIYVNDCGDRIADGVDVAYLVKSLLATRECVSVIAEQSEQLKAFADYAQKRMWKDGDKDLSEFVDKFLSL